MKLDLGSFAFGSSVQAGGGTPSWGTALGQGKGLKFSCPGWENIIAGMLYNSIPVTKVFMPIGKGGHVYNGLKDEGIQVAALFEKVYINEIRIPAPFLMVVYRDSSSSWNGRRTLKYSDKIEYQQSQDIRIKNSEFIAAAREALQLSDDACWIVSDLYVEDQDILHMFVGIVNPLKSEIYSTTEERKAAWIEAIEHTLSESSVYKKYLSGEVIKTYCNEIGNSEPYQVVYYGAPGTGKSHRIKEIIQENGIDEKKQVIRTTFHPDSDYSTFVGCYKPAMKENIISKNGETTRDEQIVYRFVPQAFTRAYTAAWNTKEDVFLIIEEINRGNCAQIFGDLFQLLDRKGGVSEYPVEADSDMADYIRGELINSDRNDFPEGVKEGKKLILPSNLYIWATMNTSDQSLFPIDSAFKRRWDWRYMPIEDAGMGWKINVNEQEYDWYQFLQAINKEVLTLTGSEDKQLGYFFAKAKNGVIDADTLVNKVYFYLWTDVFKDCDYDSQKAFRKPNSNEPIAFKDFFEGREVNSEMAEQILINLGLYPIGAE